ncbi:MAG: CRISPR-associated RAMP protein [Spirochaetales bacterium]|nr:CRISPR-associated RAMP protein [Spirochaetales bacterium]
METVSTILKNKLMFKGIISLTSALHIGGGTTDEIESKGPVVRTPTGEPYIPGSSIKGVFRSFVEQVLEPIPGLTTCQLNDTYPDCYSVGEGARKWKEKKRENLTETEIAEILEKNLCDSCKVFCSPWRASRIFFKDSHIIDWPEITQVRHGVVIDRDSETGVHSLKYDFEVIPAYSTFDFSLTLENACPKKQGIVAIGINEMLSGLMQLGGKTSRGAGNFVLKDLQIYYVNFMDMEQLKNYLRGNTVENKMTEVDDVKKFLSEKINSLF